MSGDSGVLGADGSTRYFKPLLYGVAGGAYAANWSHGPSAVSAGSWALTTAGATLTLAAKGSYTQVGQMVLVDISIDIDGVAAGVNGANVPGAAGNEMRIGFTTPASTSPRSFYAFLPPPEMRSASSSSTTSAQWASRPCPVLNADIFYTASTAAGTELLVAVLGVLSLRSDEPRARLMANGVIALTIYETVPAGLGGARTEVPLTRNSLIASPPLGDPAVEVGNRLKILVWGQYKAQSLPTR